MENRKNILIVGTSITAVALAKKLHGLDNCGEIYATGFSCPMPEFVKMVDIRDENVAELLGFVLENAIDLTIAISKNAINADIAGIFSANGQMIFAPDAESARQIIDEALTKKFLYKLKIPTSKFGVFEKQQLAADYVKSSRFPIVIKTSMPASERDLFACPTVSVANIALNDLFFKSEQKVVIEEYYSGHHFTYYVVTDGYKALPLGVVATHKFSDEAEGGFLTKGAASCMPDFVITQEEEAKIMREVVIRLLNALENSGHPTLGILGFRCLKTEDRLLVESISTFVDDSDAQTLFNSLEENLINLFEACAMGVFADDYDFIRTNDLATITLSLFSRYEGKEIEGIEKLEAPEALNLSVKPDKTQKGMIGTISASASTLSRAKLKLAEEIANLSFEGLKYRKDLVV